MSRPAVLGIIGAGSMGKGLLYQSTITAGVRCGAVCDLRIERAIRALELFAIPHEVARDPSGIVDAIRRERVAVCEDGSWIAQCEALDVMIEASSSVAAAGQFALDALTRGLPVVLMNSEIDLLYGPLLAETARRHGTVCTSCDGDQYGVLKHLIDEVRSWGFELVMAGNIKGFLDRSATASSIAAEAELRHLDHRMCASYTDGTKLNIEMAILANAYGLRPTRPGMTGPALGSVRDVLRTFDFDRLRQAAVPCVEYILGAEPGGGVFLVAHCEHEYQRQMLTYYKMGDGPYYVFYRPYHLAHIEAMRTVVEAARDRRVMMQPDFGFETNVYAYAKRDLIEGTTLDGIGGDCCYGLIETCADNRESPGIPIGLTEGVTLKRRIGRDEKIGLCDVGYDSRELAFQLFEKASRASAAIRNDHYRYAGHDA